MLIVNKCNLQVYRIQTKLLNYENLVVTIQRELSSRHITGHDLQLKSFTKSPNDENVKKIDEQEKNDLVKLGNTATSVLRRALDTLYTSASMISLPQRMYVLLPHLSKQTPVATEITPPRVAEVKWPRLQNHARHKDPARHLVVKQYADQVGGQLEVLQQAFYGSTSAIVHTSSSRDGGSSSSKHSGKPGAAKSSSTGASGKTTNHDAGKKTNGKLPEIFKKTINQVNNNKQYRHEHIIHPKLSLPRRVPWTYKDIIPAAFSVVTDFVSRTPSTSAGVKHSIGGSTRHHNQHARRDDLDRQTKLLVGSLKLLVNLKDTSLLIKCLLSLNRCLLQYERSCSSDIQMAAIPLLLRSRLSNDSCIRHLALSNLALLGHVEPPKGRGIRILSLDGGGTRGLVTIQIMKQLEKQTGQPIHKLFDFICGVSTGSLIAVMIGAFKIPLDQVEEIYKEFSTEMFHRGRFFGTSKLMTSHAYYDTQLWQDILQYNFEDMKFSDSMKDSDSPKLAAISSLTNIDKIQCYVFRNYNFACGIQSHYMGSSKHKYWEAIRASSAAPGYYEELRLDQFLHQDGGVLMNNPTPVALHEAKLLWPQETLQCVLSIGTGRYVSTNQKYTEGLSTSLKSKVYKIVQSATDTEAQHVLLHDLLDPTCYYRVNPYLSEEYGLDEINPEKWSQMYQDTELYLRRNAEKITDLANQLSVKRNLGQKVADCYRHQRLSIGW